ncbi:DUF6090 family protein [Ichthyenterobacterium sp. W332]|uniref:DUF6090 family protein n=1 Tax=Microcosmobacter mediterraneus TaxID=3075607 RepID=A0ABU2YM66_9FLAO|nr:DUF6090 family protein [Ichthyenterobacterium sp. W332]MDT0559137.1 DUF6090 family protein [Ichthyenterobacterium sp. W332]
MIKFFRHIRRSLIQGNKMGKYLKYAIGEIILVMIGILLALQVNNWNNNRLEDKEEKDVIAKLHADFKENKKTLKQFLLDINGTCKSQQRVMNLIGSSKKELNKHNLDSILYECFGSSEMAFADNTIKNIMQSGKLNLLKNENITDLLYKWNSLSEIRKTRITKFDAWANDKFIPYLLDKISFKQMDVYSGYSWTGKSKVKPDYYLLFQDIEFENYIDNYLWYAYQLKERCIETDKLIDEIIEATKP